MSASDAPAGGDEGRPDRAGLVLVALILVAGVANLNLSVANVALPDIGEAFDSSQTTLNLIAVGYSLGLAASVLYLGALGDRYGRKLMLVLGMCLSVPALARRRRSRRPTRSSSRLASSAGSPRGWRIRRRSRSSQRCGRGLREQSRSRSGPRSAVASPSSGRSSPGSPARVLRLGLGLPRHAAARRRRSGRWRSTWSRVTSTRDRSGRQPGRDSLRRARRDPDHLDQLHAGPQRADSCARASRGRSCRGGRVLSPATPGARTRSTT